MELTIKSPIDCIKYFSSLSRICANAEFGDVITRIIIFRSKGNKMGRCGMFINIVIISRYNSNPTFYCYVLEISMCNLSLNGMMIFFFAD